MTTCGKCGAENVAGDAFCGSCGAFLEFAAEEAAEEAAEDTVASPGPVATPAFPAPPPDAPTVAALFPPAVAVPSAPAGSSGGPARSAASGPICGACGRANPAGRTFCVSCGERLQGGATTARAAAAGVATTAAPTTSAPGGARTPGPGGPARPAWDFPTAPVPTAAPKSALSSAAEPGEPGGRSRLPLLAGLLVVVLLLGGGAAFVAAGGLGGGSADATASPAPSSATVPTPTPAAVASGPATPEATPAAPPTTTPETAAPATVPPGPPVGLTIGAAKASTRLAANADAKYLHDGSPASAWLSRAKAREGAWIEVAFDPAAVTRIQLWGGWQRDEPRYYGNHRPHNVTVSFDGGAPVPLELQDVLGAQRVDIPPELGIIGATRLRITIIDTYPSKKTAAKGSPSASVAVSEIRLFGVPATP